VYPVALLQYQSQQVDNAISHLFQPYVLALFAHLTVVQLWRDAQEVTQLSGVQPHHLLVCDALGLDSSWWYAVPSAPKNGRDIQTP
jgi:hypothetical protein